MGTVETYNRARREAERYAEDKMLDELAVEELTQRFVAMSRWTLKRIGDIIPEL